MWQRILKFFGLKQREKNLGTSDGPSPLKEFDSVREFVYNCVTVEPGPQNTVYDVKPEMEKEHEKKLDMRTPFGKRLDDMNKEPITDEEWDRAIEAAFDIPIGAMSEITDRMAQSTLEKEDKEFYQQIKMSFKPGNGVVVGKKLQAPPKRVKIATLAKKKKKRTLK